MNVHSPAEKLNNSSTASRRFSVVRSRKHGISKGGGGGGRHELPEETKFPPEAKLPTSNIRRLIKNAQNASQLFFARRISTVNGRWAYVQLPSRSINDVFNVIVRPFRKWTFSFVRAVSKYLDSIPLKSGIALSDWNYSDEDFSA